MLSCPSEVEDQADAIVLGEGVQLWPQILYDLRAGQLKPRYIGSYRTQYAANPLPRREILGRRDFLTTASLIATRGCSNRCGFCYLATQGLHMPYQTRPVKQVVEDFLASNEPYGVFTDNNLGADREYLRELCQALEPAERIWSAAVTIDVAEDPDLVRAMARAGCTGVFIGFESLSRDNLKDARKANAHPEDYARGVHVFHRFGIQVNGSFVFGFDHDRQDVFERTVRWIEQQRLECATFHILTPYPGTPLFRQLESEGRLFHRDWDRYDTSHCVFRPKLMSAEELEGGYAWCYRRLFSLSSIWRRRPARHAETPGYLAMSLLYKKMNPLWPFLIRHRLTHTLWHPLIELARRRHLHTRRRIDGDNIAGTATRMLPVAPGV